MTLIHIDPRAYRTSTYSNEQQCVEVAPAMTHVGVRDTKNRENGTLIVPRNRWHEFINSFAPRGE